MVNHAKMHCLAVLNGGDCTILYIETLRIVFHKDIIRATTALFRFL